MNRPMHFSDTARTREHTKASTSERQLQRAMVIVYTIAAFVGLIALSVAVHNTPYFPIDLAAARAVQSIQFGWYDVMMRIVGMPGYPPQIYLLVIWIIGALYFTGMRWEAVMETFAVKGRYRDFHVLDQFSRWRNKPSPKVISKTEKIKSEVKQPVVTWRQRVIQAGAIAGRPWRGYRAVIFQTYLLAAIVVFAILAVLAHTIAYFAFDLMISRGVQTVESAWFDALMRLVSWFGFAPQVNIITLLILVFLYMTGLKWETVVAFLTAAGISLIGVTIKLLVDRPRPSADLIRVVAELKDFSFPSGHVLFYTAFFGFLLFLTHTLLKPSVPRAILLFLLSAVIALVGLSRIYQGQHWASDVLAAYLLASVWLALMIRLYQCGKPRFFANQ